MSAAERGAEVIGFLISYRSYSALSQRNCLERCGRPNCLRWSEHRGVELQDKVDRLECELAMQYAAGDAGASNAYVESALENGGADEVRLKSKL